jgi:hypothetical protein
MIFPSPAGMSQTKLPLARKNYIIPARESLVGDIPAGDRKMPNLFLQCKGPDFDQGHLHPSIKHPERETCSRQGFDPPTSCTEEAGAIPKSYLNCCSEPLQYIRSFITAVEKGTVSFTVLRNHFTPRLGGRVLFLRTSRILSPGVSNTRGREGGG